MADHGVPHFTNDIGAPSIRIGAREFMCIGAKPPFDHPHIFLDMGDGNEIICGYCSTLFTYDPTLHGSQTVPPGCSFDTSDVTGKGDPLGSDDGLAAGKGPTEARVPGSSGKAAA
jgi:uncharacterized Zn-finger protein